MANDPNDPQWIRYAAQPDSAIHQLTFPSPVPTLGVGAYVCNGCAKPHVVIAAIFADVETDMLLDPDTARVAGMALIEAANRVDPKGTN